MGLLADFFAATPKDASQYGSFVQNGTPIPTDRFQIASYTNFTPDALGMLWAVLRHEKWNVRRHQLEHVSHTEGGGTTWLFRFPEELVHRLAALSDADLHRVANKWVNPEVPGNADELLPVLRDLKRLAIQAETHGTNLYLWGSL